MTIPRIPSYRMPDESELPDNVAGWRPDPRRAMLLIHDMQRYFVGYLPAGELRDQLIGNIVAIRRAADAAGVPVVYTAQPGAMTREERGLLRDIWGPGMRRTPADRQVVARLAPGPADVVLTKWRYSAFHRSGLEGLIHDTGRDQLIVCGVYGHVGCLMTACDAFTRDIEPFLVADAIADFSPQDHRMTLEYAARRCAVVTSTRQLTGDLRQRARDDAPALALAATGSPA